MVGTVDGDGESDGCVGGPSSPLPEAGNGRVVGASPSPCALESPAARSDGGDDGGGVSSDDGVVMSVVMKLLDDVDFGGQLR